MPTPVFTLRLPQKTKDELAQLAKVYGAPNTRAFAREILEVIVSGDLERIKAFNARLVMRMGEQLTLQWSAAAIAQAGKRAQEPRKRPRRVKEPPRRANRA